ncbi:Uncharacterized protein YR821_0331 [Yersinia ruckeri]|uniref:Uncharacterized protein n=1 Tax=Yersinia ruckeri TaxID=29486 RepID=A0A0A8VEY8_YERRU|nr:hypothetical protein yruck0001_26700 [Yersinia ruckeri ATCC 29473]QTD75263.1 Uncharacterized protein YR821_0331 [Yersinia ruckeri]CEK26161.1 hypothetical protein CSF007_1865 [Yersinia ruckeri]
MLLVLNRINKLSKFIATRLLAAYLQYQRLWLYKVNIYS